MKTEKFMETFVEGRSEDELLEIVATLYDLLDEKKQKAAQEEINELFLDSDDEDDDEGG